MTKSNQPVPTRIGTWRSPLTATSMASANRKLSQPILDQGQIYWLEGRPTEGGRTVLVRKNADEGVEDLSPAPFSVRSKAHEYGGGAYCVNDGQIYFVNYADQAIYAITENGIGQVFHQSGYCFADLTLDRARNRLIVVAENHNSADEPQALLCAIDLDKSELSILAQGADFYSSPCIGPDGCRMAWLSWMHPNMPWDQTSLHVADLDDLGQPRQILTIGKDESIFQPMFGPDNVLYFASDRDNWWNIYRIGNNQQVQQVTYEQAEIGMPQWIFGMRSYAFVGQNNIVCARNEKGISDLHIVQAKNGELMSGSLPFTTIEHITAEDNTVVCLAASPIEAIGIFLINIDSKLETSCQLVRSASESSIDPSYISTGQAIQYSTSHDEVAHGFFYSPRNARHCHLDHVLPPLLVLVHGGPTTATDNGLNPKIQYWTSRGFAVLDVNYRGSTGYGRHYRHQLRGFWGVKDVEDCVHGAQYLADQNLIDGNNLFIMGGSAGGYTVLAALAFTEGFSAGISSYGIGDLGILMDDTHKFESHYTISLVGPYDETLYRERSPLYSADHISAPVLFFQGDEDNVVPPNQTEAMVTALKNNDIPVEYLLLKGEGHGFRKSESIETVFTRSEQFLLTQMFHR